MRALIVSSGLAVSPGQGKPAGRQADGQTHESHYVQSIANRDESFVVVVGGVAAVVVVCVRIELS